MPYNLNIGLESLPETFTVNEYYQLHWAAKPLLTTINNIWYKDGRLIIKRLGEFETEEILLNLGMDRKVIYELQCKTQKEIDDLFKNDALKVRKLFLEKNPNLYRFGAQISYQELIDFHMQDRDWIWRHDVDDDCDDDIEFLFEPIEHQRDRLISNIKLVDFPKYILSKQVLKDQQGNDVILELNVLRFPAKTSTFDINCKINGIPFTVGQYFDILTKNIESKEKVEAIKQQISHLVYDVLRMLESKNAIKQRVENLSVFIHEDVKETRYYRLETASKDKVYPPMGNTDIWKESKFIATLKLTSGDLYEVGYWTSKDGKRISCTWLNSVDHREYQSTSLAENGIVDESFLTSLVVNYNSPLTVARKYILDHLIMNGIVKIFDNGKS